MKWTHPYVLRRRLATAASFERVVAAELLGRQSAGSQVAHQAGGH